MRELILNHASLAAPDLRSAIDWLRDTTVGLVELIGQGVSAPALRSARPLSETTCLPGVSFADVAINLRAAGGRDEFVLLMRLATKVPLLYQTTPNVKDQFLRCQNMTLPSPDGEPLVLCAITRGIAVGFPSLDSWDRDQLSVSFEEMLPNGDFEEISEIIDNVTRSHHANAINERHQTMVLNGLAQLREGKAVWEARQQVFPNLVFGLDVEKQLEELDPALLNTVCHRLADINQTAVDWRRNKGDIPPWRVKVTDESSSVKNNPDLRRARLFRSFNGSQELFYWHARYGSGGRIHVRLEPDTFQIQVGYIGAHLPL